MVKKTFNPLGINKLEMWTEKELMKNAEIELKRFSGVYIGGGNTFYLLRELRDSGFLLKLEKFIRDDVPVYGGSAGAVIMGKIIVHANFADPNNVKLKDFRALNLIGGRDIWPHYKSEDNRKIQQYRKKYNLNLIALPENAGIFVTEKAIEVVGPGSAYLPIEEMREVKPGQKI